MYGKILRPTASVMKWNVAWAEMSPWEPGSLPHRKQEMSQSTPRCPCLVWCITVAWQPTNMSKIAVKLSHGPAHLSVLTLLPVLTVSKRTIFPISSRRVDATREPQNLYICIPGLLHPPWMLPSPQKMPELCGAASWGNQTKAASSAPSPLTYAGSATGPYDVIPELACWLTAGFLPF